MYAFILLLSMAVIAYVTTQYSEGFQAQSPAKSTIVTPVPNQIDRSFDASAVKPFSMPGEIPVAPYQQIAAMSPLPYQDTTLIKASRQQLVSLLEMLKGFLSFESQELTEKSDPSIQLPLTTARSDLQVLQREVDVQNRNPGVQSTITLTYLNEISSNLAYLQEKVRLTDAAGGANTAAITARQKAFAEGFAEGFTEAVATKDDLQKFVTKVDAQIAALSTSGTNDPETKTRIKALTIMRAYINDMITKLTANTLAASDVPIKKSEIDKAYAKVDTASPSTIPIPELIKILHMQSGGNSQLANKVGEFLEKYGTQLINGLSASFNVKYTAPNEVLMNVKSTVDKTGFPSASDLNNATNTTFMPADQGAVTDRLADLPRDARRGPARFDWKQRAKEIEGQIKSRGLKPADFGVMTIDTPSNDFSWKGYARMMCTRLQATMDPALPETCGCPPLSWKGWRNTH